MIESCQKRKNLCACSLPAQSVGINWNQWDYAKVRRPDPPWNLLAETADLHAERWSDPPGSRWVTYLRPTDAFAVNATYQQMQRRSKAHSVARYAIDGTVLPQLQEALSLAEIARQRLQGIYGRQNRGMSSPIFSGKTAEGLPLRDHRYAFYCPTDEDGDGYLDHLTIYARGHIGPEGQDLGFEEAELQALERSVICVKSAVNPPFGSSCWASAISTSG